MGNQMRNWRAFALLAATTLIGAPPASAFFKVDHQPPSPGLHCGGSRVIAYGSGAHTPIHGNGAGVPLAKAARALVPQGWHVKVADAVANQPVAWHAGDGWVKAITANAPPDVCFVVDWRKRMLVAENRKVSKAALKRMEHKIHEAERKRRQQVKKDLQQAHAQASASGSGSQHAPSKHHPRLTGHREKLAKASRSHAAHSHGAKAKGKTRIATINTHALGYRLSPGKSLSKELGVWAQRAGWHLVWHSPHDWPVVENAYFGNDFETAIKQVVESMRANGADLSAHAYSNRVMVINGE